MKREFMLNKIIFGSSFLWFLTISSFFSAVVVFGGGVSAMPSESPTNSSVSQSQEGKERASEPELSSDYGAAGAKVIVDLERDIRKIDEERRKINNELVQDLTRHNEAQNRKLQELLNRSRTK